MLTMSQIEILLGKTALVQSLTAFRLEKRVNAHVQLNFSGPAPEAVIDQCLNTQFKQAVITVYRLDSNPKTLIFQGLLTNVRKVVQGTAFTMQAEVHSMTCLLDIKKRNRSFQDQNMSYDTLLEQVIGSKNGFQNNFSGKKIGRFYLQYQETDWEFLIRMASQLNTVIVADAVASIPKIYFGPPKLNGNATPNPVQYQLAKDYAVQRVVTENGYLASRDLDFYRIVEPQEILDLGDTVKFDGVERRVFESTLILNKATLFNQAIITGDDGFKQARLYNEQLTGAAVEATVKAVAKPRKTDQGTVNQIDRVQIKFNFENETFEAAKAWRFPYSTYYGAEGSAGWYCMPEAEDLVKVYFPNHDESQAIVTAAVRQNATERMQKPAVKYFRNQAGKAIVCSENEIVILGKDDSEGKALIRLNENDGILIYSDKAISIATTKQKDITLTAGRNIKIVAQKQVNLNAGNTSIEINGSKKLSQVVGPLNSKVVPVGNGKPRINKPTGNPVPPAQPTPAVPAAPPNKKDDSKQKHCHRHDEFLKELEQFPEDYRPALEKLHNKHIEWRFEAYDTGVNFEKFVDAQAVPAQKTTPESSYMKTPKSEFRDNGGYYDASRKAIAYFADPRNHLTEKQIFQFLSAKYNPAYKDIEEKGIANVLKGNLKGLENVYLQAGGTKVSAIFLAAKSSIETQNGYSNLATGRVEGYKGWYNMYGLDASDGTDSSQKAARAASQRGWNTREKAIIGGADKIYKNWIKEGQDTLYTMDWNVEGFGKERCAYHQYATHIKDPLTKADKFADGLAKCDVAFAFRIPVFKNMS